MISRVLNRGRGLKTPPHSPATFPPVFKERTTTPAENHRLSEPESQAHLALESNSDFRLIPRWNQIPISGSFLDWKMLGGLEWPTRKRVRPLDGSCPEQQNFTPPLRCQNPMFSIP